MLSYREFGNFMSRGFNGENWTKVRFKQEIVKNYCVTKDGEITPKGFIDFFTDLVMERGEPACLLCLMNWGYNKDLWPIESRSFILTIHSPDSLDVAVE